MAVFEEPLVFPRGQDRVCHDIAILQDDDCEILRVEDFFSNLEYVSGDQPITIDPARASVVIDDTNEPECGECVCTYRKHMHTVLKTFIVSALLLLMLT